MRSFAFLLASLLLLGPVAGASAAASPTPIAMGCGIGQTRDAAGHCRRRFDQFRRYGQFQAFKNRRCSKIQTPDGNVDRCRI